MPDPPLRPLSCYSLCYCQDEKESTDASTKSLEACNVRRQTWRDMFAHYCMYATEGSAQLMARGRVRCRIFVKAANSCSSRAMLHVLPCCSVSSGSTSKALGCCLLQRFACFWSHLLRMLLLVGVVCLAGGSCLAAVVMWTVVTCKIDGPTQPAQPPCCLVPSRSSTVAGRNAASLPTLELAIRAAAAVVRDSLLGGTLACSKPNCSQQLPRVRLRELCVHSSRAAAHTSETCRSSPARGAERGCQTPRLMPGPDGKAVAWECMHHSICDGPAEIM
ncbi:hypothetical protein HaLaN_11051 [Haematococcus lacustris]|uniref:Uncharacterized protein n=1 Tax=Haematococcus lacustris TaxID=44745 RepID=A0A699Z7T6_HAELA|nr:hypothetical protein HaLaN_11051 [Haematococcus lacustris]